MKLKLIPVAALVCLVMASCKKNDSGIASSQTEPGLLATANLVDMSMDLVTSEDFDDDQDATASDESNSVVRGGDVSNADAPCKVVTYSPSRSVYPHTKTIDYGAGCSNGVGIFISGKRIYRVEADWRTAPQGTRTGIMSFSKYTKNGISITGTAASYVIAGSGTANVKRKVVTLISYRDAMNNTSTFVGVYFKEVVSGGTTNGVKDDIYKFTGSAYGAEVHIPPTISDIVGWTTKIDAGGVIKEAKCAWRSSGIVRIDVKKIDSSVVHEVLDYGTGSCDNSAMLTVGNQAPQAVTIPIIFYSSTL